MSELTGEYMVHLADKWVAGNQRAWDAMMRRARQYVVHGERFSMERLFQFARYELGHGDTSQGFKVNNNTRAALARKMLKEHPDWKRYVDVRKSKVDCA